MNDALKNCFRGHQSAGWLKNLLHPPCVIQKTLSEVQVYHFDFSILSVSPGMKQVDTRPAGDEGRAVASVGSGVLLGKGSFIG